MHFWPEVSVCYNASDCLGNETQFCNYDFGSWGYCIKCSRMASSCNHSEFVCEQGAISCNENCRWFKDGM